MLAVRGDERQRGDRSQFGRRIMAARILIVDDDPILRGVLTISLRGKGYDVRSANSGDAGVSVAGDFKPGIVLTDIIMPGVGGIEAILELKRHQPQIKIIAMSAGRHLGGKNYLALAEKLGADRSLEKPFSETALLDAIQSLCNSQPGTTN
jgi:CheY-like chemotaxis protein